MIGALRTCLRRELTFRRQAHYAAGGLVLYLSWHWYGLGAAGLALGYGVITGLLAVDDS